MVRGQEVGRKDWRRAVGRGKEDKVKYGTGERAMWEHVGYFKGILL